MNTALRYNLLALPPACAAIAILGASVAACTGAGPGWLALAVIAGCLLVGCGAVMRPRAAAIAAGCAVAAAGVLFLVRRSLALHLVGAVAAAATDLGRALRVAFAGGALSPTPGAMVLLFAGAGAALCIPAAWLLVRRRDALWLFIAGQAALAVEWSFYYDRAVYHLFWFDIFALGAVAATSFARRHTAGAPAGMGGAALRAAALAALATLVVGGVALFLPYTFTPWRMDRVARVLTEAFPVLNRARGQVGGLHTFTVGAAGSSRNTEELGGPVSQGEGVALRVRAQGDLVPGELIYLRGTVLTDYTGRGWRASQRWSPSVPNMTLPTMFAADVPRGYLRQEIEPVQERSVTVFACLEPVRADVPGGKYLYNEEGALAVRGVASRPYAVTSRVAPVSSDHLRRLLSAYPAEPAADPALARYLDLPPELPGRVIGLARTIVAQAADDLERAELIEAYLRQLPYTRFVPRTPPGRDFIDYFLFDLEQGYCVHHSTAMVVLLRVVGIPARWVEGFVCAPPGRPGEAVEVPLDNEHAWAEAYFPGYGWLAFEATPSRPVPSRDAAIPAPVPPPSQTPGGGGQGGSTPGGHEMEGEPGMADGAAPAPRHGWAWPAAGALAAALLLAAVGRLGAAGWALWRRERIPGGRPRLAVRHCFHLAEELLASGGLPRQPHLTPLEYARQAALSLPTAMSDPLRGLAEVYCHASYAPVAAAGGGDAGTGAEAERAARLWRLLRREARRDWGPLSFWRRRLFRRRAAGAAGRDGRWAARRAAAGRVARSPLQALNETRGTCLALDVRRAASFAQRLRGLMLAPTLGRGAALLIAPCSSVHTMFMRYPIDVLYLDAHGRVLATAGSLAPWRLGPLVRGARAVLELPAGTAAATGTRDGDRITFVAS